MQVKPSIIYFVIPCYNEEAILPETASIICSKLKNLIKKKIISDKSKICFVNDGSSDKTWEIITSLHNNLNLFIGINLAHNSGHQNALLAGMTELKNNADAIITMDADLQDDIAAVDKMIEKYYIGNDIVYGVRNNRDSDSIFKKYSAELYYKILQKFGADIIYNHADYRLMDKVALDALGKFSEVNVFLRGIIPTIGLKNDIVYYTRKARMAGESKYPFKKMLAFSIEGVTSLTIEPIVLISKLGIIMFVISMLALIWSLVSYILGRTVLGWTSIIFSMWALGGLILFSIGVVGEYIGKIYLETKRRPRYIIKDILR